MKIEEDDIKRLARNFAESLLDKHVIEQLRSRNIGIIKFFCDDKDGSLKARHSGFGRMYLEPKTGKFTVLVSHNDTLENLCLILGHELAHTFSSFWTGLGRPLTKSAYFKDQTYKEEFCEVFARRWLSFRRNRREAEILFACLSQVSKCLDLASADAENIIRLSIGDEAVGGGLGCLCPIECDCQNPEPKNGVALISNECPEHNFYPAPNPNCPVHP